MLNRAQSRMPQAKAFLLKPYDYDVVLSRIRSLIALRAKHT